MMRNERGDLIRPKKNNKTIFFIQKCLFFLLQKNNNCLTKCKFQNLIFLEIKNFKFEFIFVYFWNENFFADDPIRVFELVGNLKPKV